VARATLYNFSPVHTFKPSILDLVHIPITLAALTFFIAAIVVLRLRWRRLNIKLKRLLIVIALIPVMLALFSVATRISTTSDHLNSAVVWGFAIGYIFFVILFTLLRPVWLTSLIAAILLLPMSAASAIFPLADLFSNRHHHMQFFGNGLVSDLVSVDAVTPGASGADLNVYRRFTWAPFLQRKVESARYFNSQCDSFASYVTTLPDDHLRIVCPATPGMPPESKIDMVVKISSH
jgi:peptidoglycan/LPS O-acetylase OafA/YrhL